MIYLGTVSKVVDPKKFVIEADVKGLIEGVPAYPVDTFDELAVGDPVVLWQLETVFGYSYLYQKLRLYDHTRMKIGDCCIDIDGNGDSAEAGTITLKNADVTVVIKAGGNIEITNSADYKQETSGNVQIKASGNCNIEASGNCEVKSPKVTITGGQCTIKGTVSPTGSGALCGIPACLFTGAPHSGETASGT